MPTSPHILFKDTKANYTAHKDGIDRAIHNVLDRGRYILGEEVSSFEREFADYIGARYGIGTGSGTDALVLALRACGVGPDDAVVTVSHTAVATVAAIELVGATPVLVDIDPDTFTMDPACLRGTIKMCGNKVKAVIPVHLYGHPADMPAIMDIAGKHGLYVIEDCAQSHGAAIRGRKTGAWGDMACFSFYPTKNLGAMGDAGAVVTGNAALAGKARLIREYGWKERYISYVAGMNTRLDELQAAVLRVKLRYLDKENIRRRKIAHLYNALMPGCAAGLTLPLEREGIDHAYHQYVIRAGRRDDLQAFLKKNAVDTSILYPKPVHLQPAYKKRAIIGPGGLPHTEKACREILCLPIYPELSDSKVRKVCGLFVKKTRS